MQTLTMTQRTLMFPYFRGKETSAEAKRFHAQLTPIGHPLTQIL